MKLDLHGVKHEDVSRKIDVFIWDNMQRSVFQVVIITGKSESMKELVQKCLKEYGLIGYEQLVNTGILIVDLI